ncbi:unnamed protein product [Phyllotreta striolata]|uniref:LRRCT domain-containing protein n=1 Tax=Phyllotreta striolata TaxID=444603 RepID=A0A9N9TL05_PHYSR|nr:unnamed protein product [Phyllotreta striolata]
MKEVNNISQRPHCFEITTNLQLKCLFFLARNHVNLGENCLVSVLLVYISSVEGDITMWFLQLFTILLLWEIILGEYIPPGPKYRCPKDKLLLHPCTCDIESDNGIYVSCNNTNLASMSIGLNNLATFDLPIEKLTIYKCSIGRLFGSLLYKLNLRVLLIEDTPIETIDEHTFLGVNNTLSELYLRNTSLKEFPTSAFKILGSLTTLNISTHRMSEIPKDSFASSSMTGTLLRLHIADGNLSTPLPESLQPLRKLKTLDLHGNQIKDLKRNQFKGLRDVEVLDLSFNQIPKIDGSHLMDLTKLSWLNVSNNRFTEITRGAFARNTVLKVLNMSGNKIRKLDQNTFRGMRFLRRLYLADNQIGDIGRGTFSSMKRIGTIDLARNTLKKIDYQMFVDLNFIEILDLSENQIREIQKLSFKALFLTDINLSRNQINKIEDGAFENCANITVLNLSYNQLESISKKAFDETTYATELQLSYNFFTNLSQIPLQNMTGIRILNVSHNSITTIPRKTFPKLYELHTIDFSYNNLTDIYNSVFQTLFSLRYINMSHNSLNAIKPSTFGALPTLLELDLSYNGMNSVAKSALTRLAGMRTLTLRGNNLKSMFQLPISVAELDLSSNSIERLPLETWPSMNSLLRLDLSRNNLSDNLERGSFANLLTLQRLNLNYNGMNQPPYAALGDLASLQYVYLEGNFITELARNAFGKLPVVFELDLSHNNIRNISARAFEGLLQLIELKLGHNNINSIPNGAFQGLVSLRHLDLSFNKISKMDNKTNSLLEDCLSLEKLNLSHNKVGFITKKFFPSNKYIPYKLKEVDLSYNSMPVLTVDLTIGTSKLEILNLSHNAIATVRPGVVGNITSLRTLDLSHNKLEDLASDKEFFRLPANLTELYLSHNLLDDLPWQYLRNASEISAIDLRWNRFAHFPPQLVELVEKDVDVYFEGNKLHCDCFLRPLVRHFHNQLVVKQLYKTILCETPSFLHNQTLYDLTEERLNCPVNVNTTQLKSRIPGDYDVLPDLKFRELSNKKNVLSAKWRVTKLSDIADTEVFIRDDKNGQNIVYKSTIPYFKRSLVIDFNKDIKKKLSKDRRYQICLLAKNSKNEIRNFYSEQCKDLSGKLSGSSRISSTILFNLLCLSVIFFVV